MTTNQLDLWPAMTATATTQNTPASILRKQAILLEEKTDRVVIADVERRKIDVAEVVYAVTKAGVETHNAQSVFAYSFYLIAPDLEEYRYLLFWVLHPIEMYPLLIRDSPEGEIKVESESEFLEALRRIFASEKTQRVIQAMIAQSNS